MNGFRLLSPSEREFLLDAYSKDVSRKFMQLFFGIWKAMFIFSSIGCIVSVVDAIMSKEYFGICSILALPFSFMFFWVFPNIILKTINGKYMALKENRVYIRETTLIAFRTVSEIAFRTVSERASVNSNRYIDVNYATVWNEDGTKQYEVVAEKYVYPNYPESPEYGYMVGESVYVLKFDEGNRFVKMMNNEVVVPYYFTKYGPMDQPYV